MQLKFKMKCNMDTKRGLIVLIVVVLSFVLLPSLSTQALAQVNSSFLTYTNTDLGFTMKYPSDWTIDDKNMNTVGIKFTSSDGAGFVVVTANETGKTLEDFANSLPSDQSHGFKLIEMDKSGYFLSGHPALRTIGIGSFGGPGEPGATQGVEPHDIKMMMFVTILGGKEYSVGYAALPENFSNLLQTAQTMIDSFQIINRQ
jgi:hypothetical protein